MIRSLARTDKEVILKIFNRLWKEGNIPQIWKRATIVPILKVGKDPHKPASYRPISLTSCLGKVMERMVNRRLTWILEKKKHIPQEQYGFRKHRSTMDNLMILEDEIRRAFLYREHTIAVLLDVEKAYDSVWRWQILKEMNRMKLKGELPRYIKNFLQDREIQVKIREKVSSIQKIERGVPQGSVISCNLFLMAMTSLSREIHPAKHLLYADDLIIYNTSAQVRTSQRILQGTLNKLETWPKESKRQRLSSHHDAAKPISYEYRV